MRSPPAEPPLSHHLLTRAAAARCGLLLPAGLTPTEPCDIPGLVNAGAPADPANPWQSASGAMAATREDALAGAVAEGLERLAAAQVCVPWHRRRELAAMPGETVLDETQLALFTPAQRATPGFAWPMPAGPDDGFVPLWRLRDNHRVWLPQELLGLGPRAGLARLPSTSSGLAAHRSPWLALLRAVQELLERDALAVTWLNGLGGRRIPLPSRWQAAAAARGGQVQAFDLTQRWHPHPVVAVAGSVPCEGRPRPVLGVACRARRDQALDKAATEWAQSLAFARHLASQPGPDEPAALRRFDEHAVFYTRRPELWAQTAFMAHAAPWQPPPEGPVPATPMAQLAELQAALHAAGIGLCYRELTTPDVAATGLFVMRAVAPELSGLHADERAPFLGGRTADVGWRYGRAVRHTPYPNPLPHPLG